ncbi:MAG: carbohydrate-binding family 9-like protein [Verrucomicrobiae bacterium]|nr:carbohydrate-binding family 9-like protein [Verrucomicrobiae bacterium]
MQHQKKSAIPLIIHFFCSILFLSSACRPFAQELPTIHAKFTTSGVLIDGDLSEDAWKDAPSTGSFTLVDGEKKVREQSNALLLQDKDNLYVGFVCHDSDIKNIKAGGKIFDGDSVELFLDPGRTCSYTHIGINPNGKVYFAWQFGDRKNNARAIGKLYENRWQAEIMIPFRDLNWPKPGEIKPVWGVNFCRGNPRLKEYSCWSPTLGGFHNPIRFGNLNNIKVDAKACYLAQQESSSKPKSLISISTDQTFYSATTRMRVDIKLNTDQSLKGKRLNVAVLDKDKKIRLQKEIQPILLLNQEQIDISSLPEGDYELSVSFTDGDRTLSESSKSFYRVKTPPLPKDRVEIKDGVLHLNDRPELPIFLYFGSRWGHFKDMTLKDVDDAAAKGFTALLPSWQFLKQEILENEKIWSEQNDPSAIKFIKESSLSFQEVLDAAHKNNLKVISFIQFWRAKELNDRQIGAAGKMVLKYREHPAILAWHSNDETDGWTELNNQTCKLCKELDPRHPVFLNLIHAVASNRDAADILSTDPYPIGKCSIMQVPNHADVLQKVIGSNPRQTPWLVLQMFGSPREGWPRCPTPREERCMTFLALNHGAKGLGYFTYHPEISRKKDGEKFLSEELWSYMKELNAQTRDMSLPYLLGRDMKVASCDSDQLDIAVKKYRNEVFIIACNSKEKEVRGNITLKNLSLPKDLEVRFESRKAAVSNNVISDHFAAYDVHIYHFTLND